VKGVIVRMEVLTNIKIDRLLIRQLEMQDKNVFFEYRSMPEVYRYQGWKPRTIHDAQDFINRNIGIIPNTKNTWLQLAVCLIEGQLIGDLGVHFLEDGYQVEIGYTLAPTFQGKGYATEAVKAVLNHLFKVLLKHRVTASVDPENTKSALLLERIGFQKEAHFRKSYYMDGIWLDECVYAILEEEWNL
jgi:RimJ/RimL family protein N-acetyltransferase